MADGGVLPLIDEACDASLMGEERGISSARKLAKAYYTRKRLVYGGRPLRHRTSLLGTEQSRFTNGGQADARGFTIRMFILMLRMKPKASD